MNFVHVLTKNGVLCDQPFKFVYHLECKGFIHFNNLNEINLNPEQLIRQVYFCLGKLLNNRLRCKLRTASFPRNQLDVQPAFRKSLVLAIIFSLNLTGKRCG